MFSDCSDMPASDGLINPFAPIPATRRTPGACWAAIANLPLLALFSIVFYHRSVSD
jgi:hypothetical protein